MADPTANFLMIKKMLDSGIKYGDVVETVAQLWGISPHQAEQQMTAAGYSRMKYVKPDSQPAQKPTKQQQQPKPQKPQQKQAQIKWTDDLDSQVMTWWREGIKVPEIAKRIGGTKNAVWSRLRVLRLREKTPLPPQPEDRQNKPQDKRTKLPRMGRHKEFSFTRELRSAFLWNFGLIGQQIDAWLRRREQAKAREEGYEEGTGASPGRKTTRVIDQLVSATTRGAAEVTRRVTLMGEQVGNALDAAVTAARSLVRRTSDAGADRKEDAVGKGAFGRGPGLLGLGLAAGVGAGAGLLMSTRSAQGKLHPPETPVSNTAAPTGPQGKEPGKAEEAELRSKAEKDRELGVVSQEIEAKEVLFKSDKMVFDAESFVGLKGMAGQEQGRQEQSTTRQQGVRGSTDPSQIEGPNMPDNAKQGAPDAAPGGGGGWWDKLKSFFGGGKGGGMPSGQQYEGGPEGKAPASGSQDTNAAIEEAAKEYGLDPNTMKGMASIESSMNPGSNRNKDTQYKGLFQIGREEWKRHGQNGDIYNARDNARAAARLMTENKEAFKKHFGRDPTDTEMYMMHQQGLGFYTKGTMTNIQGNPYPGMKGPQTRESFEAGWGRELARRKTAFAKDQTATRTASGPDSLTSMQEEATKPVATPATPSTIQDFSTVFGGELQNDPMSPVKQALEDNAVDKTEKEASASQPSLTVTPSRSTASGPEGSRGDTDFEVVDPTGPTFGGGKDPVPGLDAELQSPFG